MSGREHQWWCCFIRTRQNPNPNGELISWGKDILTAKGYLLILHRRLICRIQGCSSKELWSITSPNFLQQRCLKYSWGDCWTSLCICKDVCPDLRGRRVLNWALWQASLLASRVHCYAFSSHYGQPRISSARRKCTYGPSAIGWLNGRGSLKVVLFFHFLRYAAVTIHVYSFGLYVSKKSFANGDLKRTLTRGKTSC